MYQALHTRNILIIKHQNNQINNYVLHRSQPATIFIITHSPLTISAFTMDYLTYPRTLFAAAAHIIRPDPGPYVLIADVGQPLFTIVNPRQRLPTDPQTFVAIWIILMYTIVRVRTIEIEMAC